MFTSIQLASTLVGQRNEKALRNERDRPSIPLREKFPPLPLRCPLRDGNMTHQPSLLTPFSFKIMLPWSWRNFLSERECVEKKGRVWQGNRKSGCPWILNMLSPDERCPSRKSKTTVALWNNCYLWTDCERITLGEIQRNREGWECGWKNCLEMGCHRQKEGRQGALW